MHGGKGEREAEVALTSTSGMVRLELIAQGSLGEMRRQLVTIEPGEFRSADT